MIIGNVWNKYNEIIKDYFCGGIVKGVPWANEYKKLGREQCLPHQAVIKNEREITKPCLVFDPVSKIKKKLLTDSLLTGPFDFQYYIMS